MALRRRLERNFQINCLGTDALSGELKYPFLFTPSLVVVEIHLTCNINSSKAQFKVFKSLPRSIERTQKDTREVLIMLRLTFFLIPWARSWTLSFFILLSFLSTSEVCHCTLNSCVLSQGALAHFSHMVRNFQLQTRMPVRGRSPTLPFLRKKAKCFDKFMRKVCCFCGPPHTCRLSFCHWCLPEEQKGRDASGEVTLKTCSPMTG